MDRSRIESEGRKPETLHQFLPRLQSKYPLEVLSEKLLQYLKTVLDDPSLSYKESLEPIYKGYERLLYSFQLTSTSEQFSKPLILRLYQEDINEVFVQFESSLQQAILTQNFPVPEIVHICKDQNVLGGFFYIMEKIDGKNLNEYIKDNYHTITTIPRILAQTQIHIHRIDQNFVMNLLLEQGIDVSSYTFEGVIENIRKISQDEISNHIYEKSRWLIDHQPQVGDDIVVCHADLHFGNIIYDDHKVTGVVDWGKTRFFEREYDIAATLLLLEMIYRRYSHSPQFLIRTMRGYLVWMYLSEFRNHVKIDMEKIQYYKALISFQELMSLRPGSHDNTWYQETISFYNDQFEKSVQFFS